MPESIVTVITDSQIEVVSIGLNGPEGPMGTTGPSGPAGPVGASGATGPTGAQGAQGAQGATGVGDAGPTGATGPQGIQGVTGPQGTTGPQGATGVSALGQVFISVTEPNAPSATPALWVRTAENLAAFEDFRILDDGPLPSLSNGDGYDDPVVLVDAADGLPELLLPVNIENGAYRSYNANGLNQSVAAMGLPFTPSGPYRMTIGLADFTDKVGNAPGLGNQINLATTTISGAGYVVYVIPFYVAPDNHTKIQLCRDEFGTGVPVEEIVIPRLLGHGDRIGLAWDGTDVWTCYLNDEEIISINDDTYDPTEFVAVAIPNGSITGNWFAGVEWLAVTDGDTDYDPELRTLFHWDGDEWIRSIEPNRPDPYLLERINNVVTKDHGILTGLADDDHLQYQLSNSLFVTDDTFTITDESAVLTIGTTVILPDAESNAGRKVFVAAALQDITIFTAGGDIFLDTLVTNYEVAASNGYDFLSVEIGGQWGWTPVNAAIGTPVDTSGFTGNLSSTDKNVQVALNTIDAISLGGGATGPTGPAGATGAAGATGSVGATGTAGTNGAVGATGVAGATGSAGPTGATGPSGLSGDKYYTTSFTSVSVGSGSKTFSVGDSPMAYNIPLWLAVISVADNNSYMYGPITGYDSNTNVVTIDAQIVSGSGTYNNWFLNLIGEPGDNGVTGPAGATGSQGATGSAGSNGATGATGPQGATGPESTAIALATKEPMGHADKSASTISFDNSLRKFSISPVSTSFDVWCAGTKYAISSTQEVTIPNTTGLYYIYFENGSLGYQTTFFNWESQAPTAYIYWNQSTAKAEFFADERHGIALDWATHEYLHRTRGAAIASGFGLTSYTAGGDGSSNTHAQISMLGGTFFDEDLQVDVVDDATPTANTWEQSLSSTAQIPVFYRSGTGWIQDSVTNFPVKQGIARIRRNLDTAGNWSLEDVHNNYYVNYWVVATNNLNYPVLSIMGQADYNSLGGAQEEFWEDLDLVGMPVVEIRPLYRLTFKTSNSYSNTPKATLEAAFDFRNFTSTGQGSTASIVGATGATGVAGATGATGPAGATGAGTQGFTGATGPAGATGSTGIVTATSPITYDAGTKTVAIDQTSLSLDAARITSGTMATARLGSGTAGAFTVLTGAQTYTSPLVMPGIISGSGSVTRTIPGQVLGSQSTQTLVANRLYFSPILSCSDTWSQPRIEVTGAGAAGTNLRIGLYEISWSGTDWVLGDLAVDWGALTVASTGFQTASSVADFTVSELKRYAVVWVSDGTPTLRMKWLWSPIRSSAINNAASANAYNGILNMRKTVNYGALEASGTSFGSTTFTTSASSSASANGVFFSLPCPVDSLVV